MKPTRSAGEGTLLPDAKPVNRKIHPRPPVPSRRPAAVPPPESAHLALIVLAALFTEVVEMPFDQAVSRLTGVRDLMAASPGLARYRAALTGIIEGEAALLQLRAELDAM